MDEIEKSLKKIAEVLEETPNPFLLTMFKDIGLKCISTGPDGSIIYDRTSHLALFNSFINDMGEMGAESDESEIESESETE